MACELLAPAGEFATALAAFEAGADAVYCGLGEFSARAFAQNFSKEELRKLMRYAKAKDKKVYVTFNTVIDEAQLEGAIEKLGVLEDIGPDGVIVQDLGVARVCRKYFPGLKLHASTQMVVHNLEGVLALKELGFERVVLARELSLDEIREIAKKCGGMELECFIHGALCYSISGLCLFGAMEKGRSGNRGACPYCCRGAYETPDSAKTLAFSMKDLRVGEDVKALVEAGVKSLKIEGRMKSALYVASVVRWYRQMLGEGSISRGERGERGEGGGRFLPCRNVERVDCGGKKREWVTVADLETVYSRRTTELYLKSDEVRSKSEEVGAGVIDPESLGHLGTEIGVVKRVTKDREGRKWLRFHTLRALEKHDGLQFANPAGGKPWGLGISEMRQAISRVGVFEVEAGTDVEVALPELPEGEDWTAQLKTGAKVYCSMSNAVKRMFPAVSYRESDYPGTRVIDVEVRIEAEKVVCRVEHGELEKVVGVGGLGVGVSRGERVERGESGVEVEIKGRFEAAKNPEKTEGAIRKAFEKLGGTDYRLGKLVVVDEGKRFVPASMANDLRRDLVEALEEARREAKAGRGELEKVVGVGGQGVGVSHGERGEHGELENVVGVGGQGVGVVRVLKIRVGQVVPPGEWDEIVVAINADTTPEDIAQLSTLNSQLSTPNTQPPTPNTQPPTPNPQLRLALPVWTSELKFNALRNAVKRLVRSGYTKWEASDLATLRMLKAVGVTDITADWTLYAFNSQALASLKELGVARMVASPENNAMNLAYLLESGYAVEFLKQQSTPLFISLTKPMEQTELAVFERDGLWVTTKFVPRTFKVREGVSTRVDLSWNAEVAS